MDKKSQILDIAMNLSRIGNWAADGYKTRQKRILIFLQNTSKLVESLKTSTFPTRFRPTFVLFLKEYLKLEKEGKEGPKDELAWAEKAMTWGNILTHRSKLL